jgi:Farnesoic acid 0-methyl transferase
MGMFDLHDVRWRKVVCFSFIAAYLILATPDEHKYTTMWKSVENKKFWTFGVRAGGDVHVVLTTRLGRTDSDLYEFVIGGWFNNMSVIRTQILGGGESIKGTYNKTNLVSATGMRYFWISWFNGLISVSFSHFLQSLVYLWAH